MYCTSCGFKKQERQMHCGYSSEDGAPYIETIEVCMNPNCFYGRAQIQKECTVDHNSFWVNWFRCRKCGYSYSR